MKVVEVVEVGISDLSQSQQWVSLTLSSSGSNIDSLPSSFWSRGEAPSANQKEESGRLTHGYYSDPLRISAWGGDYMINLRIIMIF